MQIPEFGQDEILIISYQLYFCEKKGNRMKLTTLMFFMAAFAVVAQVPDTSWTRTFGGSDYELFGTFATVSQNYGRFADIAIDINGNIFIATTSKSSDGHVLSNNGEEDIWVFGLSQTGDTLWTRIYGGNSSERVLRVKEATTGGCYIVGHSRSANGPFSTNHSTSGYADGFVIKLDTDGNQQWMKMYGGSSDDFLYDIIETSDGYLLACGEAYSTNGDLTGAGSGMNWALKLNPANGDIVWSKTYLGPDGTSPDWLENVYRLQQMTDGSVVMTGFSTPDWNDFNLDRVSILKIDLAGNLSWTKKIGAPGSGDYPAAILSADSGNFYILAKLAGTIGGGGDANDYYGGGGDFWLVKLNASGNIIFEKNYGGTELDVPYDMIYSQDGNIYLAGMTRSTNNHASVNPLGGTDFWLLKVTLNGDTMYSHRFGGTSNDFCSGIAKGGNGYNLYLTGGTDSNDGMVSGFQGQRDLWVVKLDYPAGTNTEKPDNQIAVVYPNPASDYINVEVDGQNCRQIDIYNLNGKLMLSSEYSSNIYVGNLASGSYILTVMYNDGKPPRKNPLIILK